VQTSPHLRHSAGRSAPTRPTSSQLQGAAPGNEVLAPPELALPSAPDL
jgi:hypothetical protein